MPSSTTFSPRLSYFTLSKPRRCGVFILQGRLTELLVTRRLLLRVLLPAQTQHSVLKAGLRSYLAGMRPTWGCLLMILFRRERTSHTACLRAAQRTGCSFGTIMQINV